MTRDEGSQREYVVAVITPTTEQFTAWVNINAPRSIKHFVKNEVCCEGWRAFCIRQSAQVRGQSFDSIVLLSGWDSISDSQEMLDELKFAARLR